MDKDENIEIKSDIRKILKEIYSDVYCKFEEQYIVVFLCGGASNNFWNY